MPTSKSDTLEISKTFEIEFAPASNLDSVVYGLRSGSISNGRLIPNAKLTVSLQGATCSHWILALPEMISRAKTTGAEMLLDRTKFPNDREFGEAASILSGHLIPVGIHFGSEPDVKRFAVEATYPGDGGPFGDLVEARDRAEAEFLTRFTMTENSGYEVASDPELFARVMRKHSIRDIKLEEISPETMKSLLANLIVEVQSTGHSGPALDAAREAAELLGLDVTAAATPKI